MSLEDEFWAALQEVAHAQGFTRSELLREIARTHDPSSSLSSAIRVYVLAHYRARAFVDNPPARNGDHDIAAPH